MTMRNMYFYLLLVWKLNLFPWLLYLSYPHFLAFELNDNICEFFLKMKMIFTLKLLL